MAGLKVKAEVNIKELDRIVIGTRLYDMLDGENMNNILHRDGDGLYICEEDIIEMWAMVNPTWQRIQRVRVKKFKGRK